MALLGTYTIGSLLNQPSESQIEPFNFEAEEFSFLSSDDLNEVSN